MKSGDYGDRMMRSPRSGKGKGKPKRKGKPPAPSAPADDKASTEREPPASPERQRPR